jgi:UDP:flavonoid glycosyltransferase YjiC (YdhE family)
MSPKKSVLLFGEAVSLAHVVRPLVLAQALDPQKYDIHFACDARYQALIGASPHIQYWPIGSIPGKAFTTAVDRGGFPPSERDLEGYVRQELDLLSKLRPSLAVSDTRFTVSISAELTHTMHAALANVHWSPYRLLGFDPNPELGAPLITKRLFGLLKLRKGRSATATLNSIRKRYGLPLLQGFCELATHGDYTLYVEPPDFIKTMPMPDRHIFLGPVLWSPNVPKPSYWQSWDPERPLIYITLGSTGVATLLPTLVRSLQEMPATIVVATAGRMKLEGMSKNVYTADYLPGAEISRLAAVVVCNGGSATAYQALSQGTPVVGIWSNIDQYLTAMTIKRAGAGLCCRASDIDQENIRRLVSTVLQDSSYRANAERLSVHLSSHDAREHFRDFVCRVAA